MKTLAIRLDDEVASQLAVVAQLEGTSLVDLIRQSVAQLLDAKRADGDLGQRAAGILAEIDQDAALRKAAIAALFGEAAGTNPPTESATTKTSKRSAATEPRTEA